MEARNKKLEYLKKEYHKYDVCMGEMLGDCPADGLSIEEAFEVYVSAMNWANGDTFHRTSGFSGETEELEYIKQELAEETIQIDGTDYKVITSDIADPFDRCGTLKPGEAIRYFDKYMYRTASGEARACYADDTSNNWGV